MNANQPLANDQTARRLSLRALPLPLAAAALLSVVGIALDAGTNQYTQYVMLLILTNVVLATSLNLVNGFTGQFSLGHAGFMALGAYASAYLTLRPEFNGNPPWIVFLLSPLAGGLLAGLAGWIVGLPSLRLKGDYLAIVTLGFGEIIRVSLLNADVVGGARGLGGIQSAPEIPELGLSAYSSQFMVASLWTVVSFVTLWRIIHSARGRAFLSVRDDEIAAESMGINTTRTKVQAFVVSSFFAGVGGALFAHSVKYLNPSTFTFTKSVDIILMLVLGGLGSFTGSVIAAAVITVLPEMVLRELQNLTGIDLRMVIYSLLLILFMILRPQGILGTLEMPDLIRRFRAKRGGAA